MKCKVRGKLSPTQECGYVGTCPDQCFAPDDLFCSHREEFDPHPNQGEIIEIFTVTFPDMTTKFFPADRGNDYMEKVLLHWRENNANYSDYPVDCIVGRMNVPKWRYEEVVEAHNAGG